MGDLAAPPLASLVSSWHLLLITPGSCLSISSPATVAQDPGLNQPGGLILSPGLPSQQPDGWLALVS